MSATIIALHQAVESVRRLVHEEVRLEIEIGGSIICLRMWLDLPDQRRLEYSRLVTPRELSEQSPVLMSTMIQDMGHAIRAMLLRSAATERDL